MWRLWQIWAMGIPCIFLNWWIYSTHLFLAFNICVMITFRSNIVRWLQITMQTGRTAVIMRWKHFDCIICHHHLYPSISIYLYHHHLYPLSFYHEVKTFWLLSLPPSSFSILLVLSSISFSSSTSPSSTLSLSFSSSSGKRSTPGREHDRDGERNLPCSRNHVPGLNIDLGRSSDCYQFFCIHVSVDWAWYMHYTYVSQTSDWVNMEVGRKKARLR